MVYEHWRQQRVAFYGRWKTGENCVMWVVKHLISNIFFASHQTTLSKTVYSLSGSASLNAPCLQVAKLKWGPSAASVMMMAERPSKVLKAISLTFGRPRLTPRWIQLLLLEHWSCFEISNEKQEGVFLIILLSLIHLLTASLSLWPHNVLIVARKKGEFKYTYT